VTPGGARVSDPARDTEWRIDPDANQVDRPLGESLRADGVGLTVAEDGTVWATSGTSLLGLTPWRNPRRPHALTKRSSLRRVRAAGDTL